MSAGTTDWARYSGVLLLVSMPFWILGALPLPALAAGLPVSAAMAVCPAITVALLSRRRSRISRRPQRHTRWPTFRSIRLRLLYVLLVAAAVLLAAVLSGASWSQLCEPRPWLHALTLLLPLLLAALSEEVGWTAWLAPRLSQAWGRLRAGALIGVTWGVWHSVPYLQAGHPATWVVGQVLFSVVFRLLIVEATCELPGALLLAVSMHATYNVAWQVVLAGGSTYSPWATAAVFTGCLTVVLGVRRR